MLTQSGINAVYGTAEELAARGVRLWPTSGTPLSELVALSLKLPATCTGVGAVDCQFTDALMASANGAEDATSNEHDEIMSRAIEAIGGAINFNTQLSKDVVNPMIQRVVDRVNESLSKFGSDSSVPVEVVPVFDRAFWTTPYVSELFDRYSETMAENVVYNGPAIPFDPALLMTRIEAFDLSIAEFLQNIDADASSQKVEHHWNRMFGSGPFQTSDVLTDGRAGIDRAAILFLAAQYLSGNPPEGVDMSMSAWETMCRQLMAQAGRFICHVRRGIDYDRRNGRLVLEYPQSHAIGSRIYVDGVVYNRFLQDGGTPEVLLGAMFADQRSNMSELMAQRDAYTSRWGTSQAALVSEAVGQRTATLIRALDTAVTDEINSLSEDAAVVGKDVLHKRLRESLATVRTQDLENLWNLARRIVCNTIFPHTDAEATLKSIDEQMRANPELKVREAALYAMIDQMARWLANLISVEPVRI